MESKVIINKIREIKEVKAVNENGLPNSKKAKCSACKKDFFIKFVISQGDYSKKNTLEYWSGGEGNTKICNDCLKKLYYNKPFYWKTITDLKKRNLLKNYIRIGLV